MNKPDALIEFSITPVGGDEHLSGKIARCTRLVRESGIKNELHAMGTILEGDLDKSLELIKSCIAETLSDTPRVSASVRIDARARGQTDIEGRVRSVEEKLPEAAG